MADTHLVWVLFTGASRFIRTRLIRNWSLSEVFFSPASVLVLFCILNWNSVIWTSFNSVLFLRIKCDPPVLRKGRKWSKQEEQKRPTESNLSSLDEESQRNLSRDCLRWDGIKRCMVHNRDGDLRAGQWFIYRGTPDWAITHPAKSIRVDNPFLRSWFQFSADPRFWSGVQLAVWFRTSGVCLFQEIHKKEKLLTQKTQIRQSKISVDPDKSPSLRGSRI